MKYLAIILATIIILLAGAGYLYYTNNQSHDEMFDDISEFDSYLRNKEFDKAKDAYEAANSTLKANYNITLDTYTNQYLASVSEDADADTILNDLYAIKSIGYSGEQMDRMIKQYEDILQSNYAFETGLALYRENKYEEALDILGDVIKSDQNYETAQGIISEHYNHETVFEQAKENNAIGKNTMPNAITASDDYMYIPHINDNAYCILKIKKDSYLTHVFPIISTDYPSEMDNLNIIGDYIYFTLNANHTVDNDYSGIYRIKTDGRNLQKISDVKLKYMLSIGDKFYGVTYSEQFVEYDSRFMTSSIIYEGDIRYVQFRNNEFYFGVAQSDDKRTDIKYVRWNFEEIKDIKSKDDKSRIYQVYDEGGLVCFDYSKNNEWLYLIKSDRTNQYINVTDIANVYGILDKTIIYTTVGEYYQECVNLFDIAKDNNIEVIPRDTFAGVPMGICYEDSKMIVKRYNELYVTDIDYALDNAVNVPTSKSEILQSNQNIILNYGIVENTAAKEHVYEYKSDDLQIYIDNEYSDALESDIYYVEVMSDDFDTFDMVASEDFKPSSNIFAVGVDLFEKVIEIDESGENESTVSITGNVIESDGMVLDKDGNMQLYMVENLVTKDIYTYDNVDIYIDKGFAVVNDYAVYEDAVTSGEYIGIGMVKKGHYVLIFADSSEENDKALTPYQCGRLLSEMGCSYGYCYESNNIAVYLDGQTVFDNGLPMSEEGSYLVID